MWHQLLLFLGIHNEFDWAAPALGPEVNHPYVPHEALQALKCCTHCGGGWKHPIHQKPWDERRTAEILGAQWKFGDYSFYDTGARAPARTQADLDDIRKATKPYIEREH